MLIGGRERRHIRLLCSCDRYNYGDLLFPIVTRAALKVLLGSCDQFDFAQYGLARSDLSIYGALPSAISIEMPRMETCGWPAARISRRPGL